MGEEDCVEVPDQEGYRSLGRCFKALFGIQFGLEALPTLRHLMASYTTSAFINMGSLSGVSKYDLSATSTISLTAGTERSPTG